MQPPKGEFLLAREVACRAGVDSLREICLFDLLDLSSTLFTSPNLSYLVCKIGTIIPLTKLLYPWKECLRSPWHVRDLWRLGW